VDIDKIDSIPQEIEDGGNKKYWMGERG